MTTDYFNDYFFTSNATNHVCPGFDTFQCPPPNACARDPNTGKRYCCDYGDVCWGLTTTCASDGSTIDCGSGTDTWCCLDNREICTQTANQINICWSSHHDTLTNISSTSLNQTYSSLSSAKPSASSYTFDPLVLIQATATSSSSASSSGTPSTNSSTSTSSSASSTAASSSPSLSGGAIAGIVIGAIAVLAFLAAGVYLFMRRSRKKNAPYPGGLYEADAKTQPDAQTAAGLQVPQELPSSSPRSELQGSYAKVPTAEPTEPQELPASSRYS